MPTYKLVYFNVRARAELARLLFAAAGQSFEDERMEGANWSKYKPETPFGYLPVLEIRDGGKCEVVSQSMAIGRYLAAEFGLAGESGIERLRVDEAAELAHELFEMAVKARFAKEADKEEVMKEFVQNKFPTQCARFKTLFDKSSPHYLVAKKLTYADLHLFDVLEFLPEGVTLPSDIQNFMKNIRTNETTPQHKNIVKYLKTRPEAPY